MGGAFIAGAAAVFSPSLALLLPGYAALVAARTLNGAAGRQFLLFTAACFIASFSLVFVALGASATGLSRFLIEYLPLITSVAGIAVVLSGLFAMGVVTVSGRLANLAGAVVAGLAFGFGWKPAVDPTLAALLMTAAQPGSLGEGVALLAVYAAGLAVQLLVIALAINLAAPRLHRFERAISIVSGAVIIATGVLIFANR